MILFSYEAVFGVDGRRRRRNDVASASIVDRIKVKEELKTLLRG
jgi:hypothetical protein